MQSKESKKDSEKPQKKVKSNTEILTESNKSLKKVLNNPETSPVIMKPPDQRIKEAQSLNILQTVKSISSKETQKVSTDPKSLAQRIKASKKKYEKAFGKALEEPEIDENRDLPNQSPNSKIETTKSSNPNEDLSNDNGDSISESKTKKDEGLQFSFKEFVRGPRDLKRATTFINYLNSCEGEPRKRLLASQWFLPLVTKAIRDLINPSQLRIPMPLTDSDQGLVRYMIPGFDEGPPDKYRALYILRDFSERTPEIQVRILNDFGTYMRKAFRDALAPEPASESEQSAGEVIVEDDSSEEKEDGEEVGEIKKRSKLEMNLILLPALIPHLPSLPLHS